MGRNLRRRVVQNGGGSQIRRCHDLRKQILASFADGGGTLILKMVYGKTL
jgi:hypothetical protein